MPLLFVLSTAAFVSSFSIRILDPLVPSIARDLGILVGSAAMLAPAYTFPYALAQPVLGGIGDHLGKERIIKICLGVLTLSLAAAVIAPDYVTLLLARSLGGIAGGGIIPVAFAIVGDHVPVGLRQVALARLVMASQAAILLSAALAGMIAQNYGWRASFGVAAAISGGSFVLMVQALPSTHGNGVGPLSLQSIWTKYGSVLEHPLAALILAGAMVEGIALFGLLPFVAYRLEVQGLGGIKEAGLVLATMSVGGITFTLLVGRLLLVLGREWLIRCGGLASAIALAGIAYSSSWAIEAAWFALLGFGFFMIHNSLQLMATEMAPRSRASSVALFAFSFFLGQAMGPLLYHYGFELLGLEGPLIIAAAMLLVFAFGLARILKRAIT